MTPDRLAGIYLVGGSSRIPLIATLIAEELRVVPTSLDQPETAVALGAHHVTRRASACAPGNIGAQAPPTGGFRQQAVPAVRAAEPPVSSRSRAQRRSRPIRSAAHVPTRSRPASPQPATRPAPRARRSRQQHQAPRGHRQAQVPARRRRRSWCSRSSPSAPCSSAAGQRPADRATTASRRASPTARASPPCLRQLAGTVADNGDCKSGRAGRRRGRCARWTTATRSLRPGRRCRTRRRSPNTELARHDRGRPGRGRLEGQRPRRPLAGGRRAAAPGVLVFTVKDRPLVGWLSRTDCAPRTTSPRTLADYFAEQVQPGT